MNSESIHHTAMIVADSKEWQMRARQCFKRAITQQRPQFREDNEARAYGYIALLRAIGYSVDYDSKGLPVFQEPSEYRLLTKDVIDKIKTIKDQIKAVSERRIRV